MMGGWMEGMGSMGWWGGPWMIVVWIGVIVGLVVAVRWLIGQSGK